MRIRINTALGVVLAQFTVTNDIPKRYSMELSVTNDIPKGLHHVRTYALAEFWTRISCLVLIGGQGYQSFAYNNTRGAQFTTL